MPDGWLKVGLNKGDIREPQAGREGGQLNGEVRASSWHLALPFHGGGPWNRSGTLPGPTQPPSKPLMCTAKFERR